MISNNNHEMGGLVFVPVRKVSYSRAMSEIRQYIKNSNNKKVYISELAEELQIDMDLIKKILTDDLWLVI